MLQVSVSKFKLVTYIIDRCMRVRIYCNLKHFLNEFFFNPANCWINVRTQIVGTYNFIMSYRIHQVYKSNLWESQFQYLVFILLTVQKYNCHVLRTVKPHALIQKAFFSNEAHCTRIYSRLDLVWSQKLGMGLAQFFVSWHSEFKNTHLTISCIFICLLI